MTTVEMSVFTSAFADTSNLFRLRTIDTFDPRAGQKCGKYSNQTKVWIECVRLRFSLNDCAFEYFLVFVC